MAPPGGGYQIIGELYEVNEGDLARMDRLERIGEPQGYERVEVTVERFDLTTIEQMTALVYLKQEPSISPSTPRIGPLAEYTVEHAARFHWQGAA